MKAGHSNLSSYFINFFKENEYNLNVTKLLSGTIVGNLLILTAMPFLSRLYYPEAFGTFQQFISFSSIFVIFSTLSFHSAIVLPKARQEVSAVVCISLASLISITSIIIFSMGALPTSFFNFLNADRVIAYKWFIPVIVFCTGLQLILENLMLQQKQFIKLSAFRVIRIGISQIGALILSLFFVDFLGLLLSYVLSFVIVSALLMIYLKLKNIFKENSLSNLFEIFRKYIKFPLVDTPSMLINTISNEMPIFLLTIFHTPEKIGFYTVAFRLLRAPFSVLGSSFSEAYFQKGSEIYNSSKSELTPFFLSTIKKLILIGLVPCLVIFFFANKLVALYLGAEWTEVARIMQILTIWLFFEFIYNPVSTSFLITKRLEILLILNLLLLLFRTAFMYIYKSSSLQLITALSLTSAGFYLIYILSAFLTVKRDKSD